MLFWGFLAIVLLIIGFGVDVFCRWLYNRRRAMRLAKIEAENRHREKYQRIAVATKTPRHYSTTSTLHLNPTSTFSLQTVDIVPPYMGGSGGGSYFTTVNAPDPEPEDKIDAGGGSFGGGGASGGWDGPSDNQSSASSGGDS